MEPGQSRDFIPGFPEGCDVRVRLPPVIRFPERTFERLFGRRAPGADKPTRPEQSPNFIRVGVREPELQIRKLLPGTVEAHLHGSPDLIGLLDFDVLVGFIGGAVWH